MPTTVTVRDADTGLSSTRFRTEAAEMVAREPSRYAITDTADELAMLRGRPGLAEGSAPVGPLTRGIDRTWR